MAGTQRGPLGRLWRLLGRDAETSTASGPVEAGGLVEVEAARRICPHCKAQVSRGATVCIHCERDLAPLMDAGEFNRRFGGVSLPMADSEEE